MSKKKFVFIFFIIFSLMNLNHASSIEPDVFVQSTVNRASQVLSDNLSKEEKIFWKKFTEFTFNKKEANMPLHGKFKSFFSQSFLKRNPYIFSE